MFDALAKPRTGGAGDATARSVREERRVPVPKPAPKPARRGAKPASMKVVTKKQPPATRGPAKPTLATRGKKSRTASSAAKSATVRKPVLAGKPKPQPAEASSKAKRPAAAVKPLTKSAVKADARNRVVKDAPTVPLAAKPKLVARPAAKAIAPPVTPGAMPVVPRPARGPVAAAGLPVAGASPPAKAKKNASGLGVRDLQHFADLLLEKRREIVGDMHSMEGEALRSGNGGLSNLPVHLADMGTDNYEQEFTLGLVEKDRSLLREINHALAKIPAGTYGICEGTGEAIGKPRLEVQPWARHGIEYARQRERNGRGVRVFF